MPILTHSALVGALLVSFAAAVSDWRRGTIPNWLTLPPLALAPVAYGASFGIRGALHCLTAAALCGAVPYFLFRRSAMGGGDVKLFAALGALTGADLFTGLEIQIGAFVAAMVSSVLQLMRTGGLRSTLRESVPRARALLCRSASPSSHEAMTPVRLGAAVSFATFAQCAPRIAEAWSGR